MIPTSPTYSNKSSNTLQVPGDNCSIQNNYVNINEDLKDKIIDEENLDKDLNKLRQETLLQTELDDLANQLNQEETKSNHSQKSHNSARSYTSIGGTYYSRVYVHRPIQHIHYPNTRVYSYLEPIQEVITPQNRTHVQTIIHEPRVTYSKPVTYHRRENVTTRIINGERVRYVSPVQVKYISPSRRVNFTSTSGNTYYRHY